MDSTPVKLPIHQHSLLPTARFLKDTCDGCHVYGIIYGGYFCNEPGCSFWSHKYCAEAPSEINHPFHTQHHLLLTSDSKDGPCDLCGKKMLGPCYSCPTCEFTVDLSCGMKPLPPAIKHPLCHEHPLVFLKKQEEVNHPCELCKKVIDGPLYSCFECNNVYFHVECIHFSKEVNHPSHCNHPLDLIATDTLMDDAEKNCLLCGDDVLNGKVFYRCSICNFNACLHCTRNPPPLVIEHIKTHKHPLNAYSRRISFTCDVCGLGGTIKPYICFQCGLFIHRQCIHVPRVININRHDHRISFTHHLGPGYSTCGVCRQSLSQYHGAFRCSVCPYYAVHSQCAIKYGVWDGRELEGILDDMEDIAPFKVVGDNLISHFSHDKHPLKLKEDSILSDEWRQCEACLNLVGFDPIYSCEGCSFVLHDKCANLPTKKRLFFDTIPFTLEVDSQVACCKLCRTLYGGFKYATSYRYRVDVQCGSLSEPLSHDGHIDPLYFYEDNGHWCDGCGEDIDKYMLRCDSCNFDLCCYCACLPEKIKHWKDEHPLTLYCGETVSKNHLCDYCEKKIYPCKWFYTCYYCGVSLHARCVRGDFSRLKGGYIINYWGKHFEVVLNNHNTRPICYQCHSRCKVSDIILKSFDEDNGYICSYSCLHSFLSIKVPGYV